MNKKILTPLFIAASFSLIACSTSEIIGRPKWIDDPIVIGGDEDTKDNTLKEIYDAIKKLGDTNSNALNKVMYDIAQKHLGTFEELKALAKDDATDVAIKTFVDKHPIYKSEDIGWKKGEDKETTLDDAAKTRVSRKKIKNQYDRIIESVFESLYNDVKGGEYCSLPDKKLFQEEYFIDHLYEEMYWPEVGEIGLFKDKVLLPKKTGESWQHYVSQFLNVMDASGNFTRIYYPVRKGDGDTDPHHDGGYIGRKILPEIYRTLLIENYVREQRYTNLGRSYARKVKMISIPYGEVKNNISKMLTYFAKTYITGSEGITDKYNLDYLNEAMIGFAWDTDISQELLTSGDFKPVTVKDTTGTDIPLIWKVRTNSDGTEAATFTNSHVYKGTKLGDLVEKYLSTQDVTVAGNPTTYENFTFTTKDHFNSEAQSAYDDITNKGAYDLETGLIIKEREIRATDLTQDGWFLKDGGLTDLNETFRNKLFNIKTSNIIDDEDYIAGEQGVIKNDDTVRYYGKVGGKRIAFVRDAGQTDESQIVLNDLSSNFYMVEVDEAASSSKLSTTDLERSYLKLKATDSIGESNGLMHEIVSEVVKQVGSSDTYKKNAEQYYLMISNILFYDQSVYDYFKSQFPDLFK